MTDLQSPPAPFYPNAAKAIGTSLVRNGRPGDGSSVAGLTLMLVGEDRVCIGATADDDPPEWITPDDLERIASFLLGVAAALRVKSQGESA